MTSSGPSLLSLSRSPFPKTLALAVCGNMNKLLEFFCSPGPVFRVCENEKEIKQHEKKETQNCISTESLCATACLAAAAPSCITLSGEFCEVEWNGTCFTRGIQGTSGGKITPFVFDSNMIQSSAG